MPRSRLGRGCGGVFSKRVNISSRRCSAWSALSGAVMASRNRGKKKPSLRELIKINLDNKEMEELWGKFNERQTPIVTAVLGQALVENELD